MRAILLALLSSLARVFKSRAKLRGTEASYYLLSRGDEMVAGVARAGHTYLVFFRVGRISAAQDKFCDLACDPRSTVTMIDAGELVDAIGAEVRRVAS